MNVWSRLIDLIVPPACAVCGGPGPAVMCDGCLAALSRIEGACPRCALPRHRAGGCPARGAPFAAAWAAVVYAGTGRAAVLALKGRARLAVAHAMAEEMAVRAPPWLLRDGVALVPVPTAPARRRARGFDPPALLARAVGEVAGLDVAPVLTRRGRAAQAGAGVRERRREGRLDVRVRGTVPDRCVLVDDVHTTGATLRACAQALRAAGARDVVGMTFARTP